MLDVVYKERPIFDGLSIHRHDLVINLETRSARGEPLSDKANNGRHRQIPQWCIHLRKNASRSVNLATQALMLNGEMNLRLAFQTSKLSFCFLPGRCCHPINLNDLVASHYSRIA